jgi:hypothetical protein
MFSFFSLATFARLGKMRLNSFSKRNGDAKGNPAALQPSLTPMDSVFGPSKNDLAILNARPLP